jgi:predicted MFS family arabinose efflux permease
VPIKERSRSLSLVYSGMYTGSMLGLAVSPQMIGTWGWSSVFYAFGAVGLVWYFWWQRQAAATPGEDPYIDEVGEWQHGWAEAALLWKGLWRPDLWHVFMYCHIYCDGVLCTAPSWHRRNAEVRPFARVREMQPRLAQSPAPLSGGSDPQLSPCTAD